MQKHFHLLKSSLTGLTKLQNKHLYAIFTLAAVLVNCGQVIKLLIIVQIMFKKKKSEMLFLLVSLNEA